MPSAITWEEGPDGSDSATPPHPILHPDVTHRLDLFTVQFAAVHDHGMDSVSQAGCLHFCVPDEHKVLQIEQSLQGGGPLSGITWVSAPQGPTYPGPEVLLVYPECCWGELSETCN